MRGPLADATHNPDQYMTDLRTIVGQGRKRIGFLVGAGGPAGMMVAPDNTPLIPAVARLTELVLDKMPEEIQPTIDAIKVREPEIDIEGLLSKVRSLSKVIGAAEVDGLNGDQYAQLSETICAEIGAIVDVKLPDGDTPYRDLINWVVGTDRRFPIEIFTTNYDRLFEEALERARAPYFDGFSGSREPFFDGASVANDELPARWARLWKLHGSLGWKSNEAGETTRSSDSTATHMIYPEHQKFDQTQKAPYAALFDRLQNFLKEDDTLLIASGFSFNDAHVAAKIDEALAANPTASVFAFQYKQLAEETAASKLAQHRPNFSVYARDRAIINGVSGRWLVGELPSRDWASIRATYWQKPTEAESAEFVLGDFGSLSRFLALARANRPIKPANEGAAIDLEE
jgi:hypothetical protein